MPIPVKCRDWKVANHRLTAWWCRAVCGKLTRGKLCEPWCRVAERHGMWTLFLTFGLPAILIVVLLVLLPGKLH